MTPSEKLVSACDEIAARDAIEARARGIIVKVLRDAAKRGGGAWIFDDIARDVGRGYPAEVPSWIALDAVIAALGGTL